MSFSSQPPNLFEMMREAGERERLIAQGKLLGLSDEQARLVVETLGPAALAGLQRAQVEAGTVMQGLAQVGTRMMQDAASGAMTGGPAAPPSPAASLFGSPAAADAVADRIASMTGVDQTAMRQLVPAFSASVLAQMAVLASLPALAPMREAMEGMMAHAPGGAPSQNAPGGAPSQHAPGGAPKQAAQASPEAPRMPDAADMMAPFTQFMQNMTAMMGSAVPGGQPGANPAAGPMPSPGAAAPPSEPDEESPDGPGLPSFAEAVEAQTQAWNAFLSGLAKEAKPGSEGSGKS